MTSDHEVLAYYFPSFHVDPLNERWHGQGWTEWDLLRAARPRFDGHRQPIVPAWGEFDESDPIWASREIDLAADHGVTTFLYDWYWYEGAPFLHRALEEGFMAAPNRQRMKFALMWANHDWVNIHPARLVNRVDRLTSGRVDSAELDRVIEYIIDRYFTQPNYLTVDGEPYFSIYDLTAFIDGVGGIDAARSAIERFRDRATSAGLGGIHLNVILAPFSVLPTDAGELNNSQIIQSIGASSVGTYTWIHNYTATTHPTAPYAEAAARNFDVWRENRDAHRVPYQPNVSMGWDPSPRTVQTDRYEAHGGYPFMPILTDNTPAAFEQALAEAKRFLAGSPPAERIVTINAWNEWTEGSYLLPDTVEGNGYLEAVKAVFGSSSGGRIADE